MADYPVPTISPHDYDAFRRILNPHLSDTYDEWLQLHTKYVTSLLQVGQNVRQIEVHPDEFGRFCNSRGASCNLKTLLDFAIEKVAGNNY